jgi:3-phenylpropionate/trans-cinnamate dioxygenase ferredoxin subunit
LKTWLAVVAENKFSGSVHVAVHKGKRIAVFKADGAYYAINDTCSHADASLAEGELCGYEIECMRHGARFDIRTGQNLSFPAVTPVRSYPVKLENAVIYVEVEE